MKLAVLMPAFNVERYVGAAIRSILRQTFRDFRLIVYDDGSTDGTHEELVLQAKKFSELKVITLARNYGQTGALDAGLK